MNYRIMVIAAAAIWLTGACSSDRKSDGSSATSAASTPRKSIAPAVSPPTDKSSKDNETTYHRYRSYSGTYQRTSSSSGE